MEECDVTFVSCLTSEARGLDKAGYEIARNSILKNLLAHGTMTSEQLGVVVKNHLQEKYYCTLWEHYETVRKDLELRGELRLVTDSRPPLIELAR